MGAYGGPFAAFWLQPSVFNYAPVLPLQTNRTIGELTSLTVTNAATDANLPATTLIYTLLTNPPNATIDASGIIRWTPSEAQGPSTNVFTTKVTDNGLPNLSATNSFLVIVAEANTAPVLIGPTSINITLTVTNPVAINVAYTVMDGDIPGNELSYVKVSGPAWLSFTGTGTNAQLTGAPPPPAVTTNFSVTISVIDNGTPAMSNQLNVAITVNPGPVVKVAVINPDYFRVLKMSLRVDPSNSFSIASGTLPDPGSGRERSTYVTAANWLGVGSQADFIGSVLAGYGYTVDYFDATNLPNITALDYRAIIIQDPVRTNCLSYPFLTNANPTLPDLLEFTTNPVFLGKITNYVASGGSIVLIGDAVRLLENGTGRLNYGKTVQGNSVANSVPVSDPRTPGSWLFIRGNPFCGVDRAGSGTYDITPNSMISPGARFQNIALFNGNDQAYLQTWADTVFAPTDGISLMDVKVSGAGQYVLNGSVCSPTVYTVTVTNTIQSFMGYTTAAGRRIYYMGSDALFDYAMTNRDGAWHASSWLSTQNTVSPAGRTAIAQLVGMAVASAVINRGPVFAVQTNRTVGELTQLVVTNTATDSEVPANVLSYILLTNPANATIDGNGIIRWTPTEQQGPSTNIFTTRVTENGSPNLSATNSFTVIVTEVNTAPTLVGPTSINNTNPAAINVPYTATDADVPANTLTFLKVSGPTWLSFTGTGATNAHLTGTPPTTAVTTNYAATLSVVDNGTPAMSNTVNLVITVNPGSIPATVAIAPTGTNTVLPGASVTYTANATGSAPLGYQWRLNGSPIAGATGSSYPIPSAQRTNAGLYDVIVSNAAGSVTSAPPARLIVNTPPVWTSTPVLLATQGQPYLYLLGATDADNDPLNFSAPTLPSWLTFVCGGTNGLTTTAPSGREFGYQTGGGVLATKQVMSMFQAASTPALGIDWVGNARVSASPVPNYATVGEVRTYSGEGTFAPTVKSQEPFDPALALRPANRVAAAVGGAQVVVNPSAALFPDITVNVTVLDANSNSVSGLPRSAFTVQEQSTLEANPVGETITSFQETSAGAGISFSLVFDASGSMAGQRLADAKAAAIQFLGNTVSSDRGSLVRFSDDFDVRVVKAANWVPTDENGNGTNDLVEAIQGLGVGNLTALWDGTAKGIESLSQEPAPVFTDGADNDSAVHTINSLITKARNEGVPVYTIALGITTYAAQLSQVATNTGGSYYYAPTAADMGAIYQQIARQVRSRYVITYRTHNPNYDGTLRTVTVTANSTTGSGTYRVNGTPVIALDAATVALSAQSQPAGVALPISGTVTDLDAQSQAQTLTTTLYYRQTGTASFASVNLTLVSRGAGVYAFSNAIPAAVVLTPGVEYYLRASDGIQEVYLPFNYNTDPISIAVLPNRAPVIVHTPITSALPSIAVNIAADVTDADAGDSISRVILNYRLHSALPNTPYHPVTMTRGSGNTYSGVIPAGDVTVAGVDYYISAWDTRNVRADSATALRPYFIAVGNGCRLVGTPGVGDVGTHTVVLQVSDGYTNVAQTFTITVIGTNAAPQLIGRTSISVTNPTSVNEPYTATDNAVTASSLSFSLASGPAWLSFTKTGATNAVLSGTPPTVTGVSNYTAVLRVVDNGTPALSNQVTVTITVIPAPIVNVAPILFGRSSINLTNPTTVAESYYASDGNLPGTTLTFSLVSGPAWLSFARVGTTNAQLSGTPPVVTGVSNFAAMLQVTDSGVPVLSNRLTVNISLNPAPLTNTPCFVTRDLPTGYVPGTKLVVTLTATPPAGTSSYTVRDVPPSNWSVGAITSPGQRDPVSGEVKFAFLDGTGRTLSYEVTPPTNEAGLKMFSGNATKDGGSSQICGENIVDRIQYHPADRDQDFRLQDTNLTAYATAWLRGQTWPTGPNPIPVEYVSRAVYLWLNGEGYTVDPFQPLPLSWVPTLRASVVSRIVAQAVGVPNVMSTVRLLPPKMAVGVEATVTIIVSPAATDSGYAVEETPPAGWTISNVNSNGVFDVATGRVRWPVFTDNLSRTLN